MTAALWIVGILALLAVVATVYCFYTSSPAGFFTACAVVVLVVVWCLLLAWKVFA